MTRQIAADHLAGTVAYVALPEWDDTARTVTTYDEAGAVTSTRPYTEAENAAADEAAATRAEAEQQQARYETHEAILDATASLMTGAHTDGQPWAQPTGAHDAVPLGITVTNGGKTWRSKHHANVWPPSPSSPWWEEVTNGDPGPQPWALGTYYKPPTKVTFAGKTYECTFEHLAQPGWEPNNPTMHAVWKLT